VFCPNCGTQNDDDGAKCQKCGFNLKGAAAPKFKGTMLMMNSPMAAAPRPAPTPGGSPGPAPWPKSMAKATMIGVAPPSPGGIVPPAPIAPKSPATHALSGAPLPATPPPTGSTAPVARPGAGPAAGVAPVNPFGGTMLMGATPLAAPHEAVPPQAALPQQTAEKSAPDRTVTSEGAPPAAAAAPAKLETTTPSVSPPAQLAPQVSTQNEMPAMGSAHAAPAPADPSDLANAPAFPNPNWGVDAVGAGAPLASVGAGIVTAAKAQSASPQVRPIGKVVGLGILTLGIYWLIALWGAFNDFKVIRQKNDIVPIYFFVPVLGWLELTKLPGKVMEARTATAVQNPAVPNVVLYLLFPQIFFIADLNEIIAAVANRRTLT
jgi:hypothetical protein